MKKMRKALEHLAGRSLRLAAARAVFLAEQRADPHQVRPACRSARTAAVAPWRPARRCRRCDPWCTARRVALELRVEDLEFLGRRRVARESRATRGSSGRSVTYPSSTSDVSRSGSTVTNSTWMRSPSAPRSSSPAPARPAWSDRRRGTGYSRRRARHLAPEIVQRAAPVLVGQLEVPAEIRTGDVGHWNCGRRRRSRPAARPAAARRR